MKNNPTLKKRLYVLSAICLAITVVLFVLAYLCFHYVTDDGITLIKQAEAGKPFVTNLIGCLGVQTLSFSILSALVAAIVLE